MPEEEHQEPAEHRAKLRLTAEIVAAYVANHKVELEQLPDILKMVHRTIEGLENGADDRAQDKPKPAVPIGKSLHSEYIICLEDGKKLKMLKRYLRSKYGLTPDEYRRKWGLPADYPMVAPAYAAKRSEFAKEIGLGRRGDEKDED